jgi:hypothetical protein
MSYNTGVSYWYKLIRFLEVDFITIEKRRSAILRLVLLACIAGLGILTIDNLAVFVDGPSESYAWYLLSDAMALVILAGIWWMAKSRKNHLAAVILIVLISLGNSFLFPFDALERIALIYAIPILLASFLLSPFWSFGSASLSTFCFTLAWWTGTQGDYAQYNIFIFIGLFILALISAIIATILERSSTEQVRAYNATIQGWAKALELRDKETEGHSLRVARLSLELAGELCLPRYEIPHFMRGVLLHDIGKMAIPDVILFKPGPLTPEEWAIMRKHPEYGYEMLSHIAYLAPALVVPRYHHEKWDGSGYPCGLQGEEIPIYARIFAIVDVWDALLSDRPYRKAWTPEESKIHIASLSGKHFDPQVVEAFLRVIDRQPVNVPVQEWGRLDLLSPDSYQELQPSQRI